jgi:uncharacterized protein
MLIKLADIEDAGLELGYEETPQDLGLVYPDTRFKGGVFTKVRIFCLEETVMVSGHVEAVMVQECGRCTKPFTHRVQLPFETIFSPIPVDMKSSKDNKDHEISVDEVGLYFYSGETIDLGEFVREQILLSLPMVPLCNTKCRGLCIVCGQDRNITDCGCIREEENGTSKT